MMRALYTLRPRPVTDAQVADLRTVVEEQAPELVDYFFGEVTA